jgi:hypothetical protein
MSEVLNMIVPYGTGEREGLAANPDILFRGRLVPLGGDRPKNAYGYSPEGRERRDVLIPPGLCAYFWLGCSGAQDVGNFCTEHAQQNEAEERSSLATMDEERNRRRRERRTELQRERRRGLRPAPVILTPEEAEERRAARRAHRRKVQRAWRARKRAERAKVAATA